MNRTLEHKQARAYSFDRLTHDGSHGILRCDRDQYPNHTLKLLLGLIKLCLLHTERCRSYRSYKYIPFTYYQSLRNSYNVYTFMIHFNQNLFRAFLTRVSPELIYPSKVVRYSAGLRTTSDQL